MWEYKAVYLRAVAGRISDNTIEERLAPMGAIGWELVGFIGDYAVMKRPK